jgi:type I restriction enzyme R subunit
MNKKDLSERDICSKFIGPAIKRAGWDGMMQIREEVAFTKGRIIVRGKLVTRGKAKRADYILYYKPNIPIAIIEAKDNNHSVDDGMQQALDYDRNILVDQTMVNDFRPFLTCAIRHMRNHYGWSRSIICNRC